MQSKKSYKEKMKELRGFVDFDYDLRKPLQSRSKGKIDTYWKELQESKGQSYRVYRPRSKSRLKQVREAAGVSLKGFKAIPIPNPNPQDPTRVIINKGGVTFSNKSSNKHFFSFNKTALSKDSDKEARRVLAKMDYDRIQIATGKFRYRETISSKKRARELINRFVGQYENHKEWMHGLFGIDIKNQELMDAEMANKAIYKSMTKRQRQAYFAKQKASKKNGKAKNSNG
jgi:hypothetical protein